MTTFICTCCDVRTEWGAGVQAPMTGEGRPSIRICEECASCVWCDEWFRLSHPAHMREHNAPHGRDDSAAFICVHCYALVVHGMKVVIQPDGKPSMSPLDGGAQ